MRKESAWLSKTIEESENKENHWPGAPDQAKGNKAMRVTPLMRETKSEMSPLKPVGPGTERATFHRRVIRYRGVSSEGNRFVNNSDL